MKLQNSVVKVATLEVIRILFSLFATLVISISLCKGQTTVFLDFTTNDTIGENIIGQTPDIGLGALEGDSGGTLQITTNYSINTVGAARLVFGAYTSALGPGQELSLSYNLLNFGPAFPNSDGFAGVSLYTGYSSYSNNVVGNEEEFVGEPYNVNQWGLDQGTTGFQETGNTTTPATAIFTYVYNTGAWTFTTSGGVNLSGMGEADQAFNAIRIANGGGADIELNNLKVVVGPVGSLIITQEPTPVSQILFPGQMANISVQVTGAGPITNMWLVESNGIFVRMANGTDRNGSVISGATTTNLTISNLKLLDGTNYEFIASNALGSQTGSLASVTVPYVAPPVVTNAPATDVQTFTATLNGQVTSSGGETPTVTLFYGTNNGGAIAAHWSNSVALGYQAGVFSDTISSLTPGSTYYFTAQAANGGGTNWAAPSFSFATPQLSIPVVANQPASSVQGTIATLNGNVVNPGGETPMVTLFYGPTDGGTTPGAWANSISLGLQGGTFAQTVTGLTPNSTYYFAAEAVNAAGSGWGTPSQKFTTVATNSPWPYVAVLTQHNDNNRSGENLNETTLNAHNISTNTFGLLYIRPVDDQVYSQPLIMTNVSVLGHGSRNLLIVTTVNDSIYAFDADDPTVTQPYWKDSFISPPNIVAPANTDESAIGACGGDYVDYSGKFGTVGTPVIDPVSRTLYVVVRTKETSGGNTSFVQRLHALDVTTGADRSNSPVVISATYPGNGDGSSGGLDSFDSERNNQRSGLALANGIVYIAWSSHCDNGPYHGWVIGYNETNLQQVGVYNDTPNGGDGGIWMSGQAPCADTNGNIYLSTGNGTTDTTTNGDYGESFLKLTTTNGATTVASYFTAYNYTALNNGDIDLGCAGVLLIPGTDLAISGGKAGVLYLVNRDKMGGLSQGNADTNVLETWSLNSDELHGGPVWWSTTSGSFMYIWPQTSDHLRQFQFASGMFNTTPYAEGNPTGGTGSPGGIMSLSANGTNAASGILWATVNTTSDANQAVVAGTLHAFSAQNVTNELWNSDMIPGRDSLGNLAKFVPPTVANGKVYVATFSGQVDVYGLLPSPALTIGSSQNLTTISWPTNAYLNFTLQSSTNLNSGKWVNVPNAPAVTNGMNQVTVPVTVPAIFYRLTL